MTFDHIIPSNVVENVSYHRLEYYTTKIFAEVAIE